MDVVVPTATTCKHDDVIKWKHFPRNWPFVREIHRSPVNFPHKGQWRGALMFSLIYAWINDWVNYHEAGDLRRQHGHYDVIVMNTGAFQHIEAETKSVTFYRCHFHTQFTVNHDVVRNDNETTISQCAIYFQLVTTKRDIISNSPIAWKFDRWLTSNAAKPHLPFFKVHDWSISRVSRHNLTASRVQDTW